MKTKIKRVITLDEVNSLQTQVKVLNSKIQRLSKINQAHIEAGQHLYDENKALKEEVAALKEALASIEANLAESKPIDKITPNVKHWVELAFNSTDSESNNELWNHLNSHPESIPQAVAYAHQEFLISYPCLPFDKVAQENRSHINFEFFITRRRFNMNQRGAYEPAYFNELCIKYGFPEEVIK